MNFCRRSNRFSTTLNISILDLLVADRQQDKNWDTTQGSPKKAYIREKLFSQYSPIVSKPVRIVQQHRQLWLQQRTEG